MEPEKECARLPACVNTLLYSSGPCNNRTYSSDVTMASPAIMFRPGLMSSSTVTSSPTRASVPRMSDEYVNALSLSLARRGVHLGVEELIDARVDGLAGQLHCRGHGEPAPGLLSNEPQYAQAMHPSMASAFGFLYPGVTTDTPLNRIEPNALFALTVATSSISSPVSKA